MTGPGHGVAGCLLACLLALLPSNTLVSLGDGSAQNCTCCHAEVEAADQSFYLTHSELTDTGPTSPGADPIPPGAWQGSHWDTKLLNHWYDSTWEKIHDESWSRTQVWRCPGGRLTTRPTTRCGKRTPRLPHSKRTP